MRLRHGLAQQVAKIVRGVRRLGRTFRRRTSDRRSEDRLPYVVRGRCADLTGTVRKGTPFETCIIDISRSGCQILSDVALHPSGLVSLKLNADAPTERLATVTYSLGLGKIYRSGLLFVPPSPCFT